jgi:hypothetical protein
MYILYSRDNILWVKISEQMFSGLLHEVNDQVQYSTSTVQWSLGSEFQAGRPPPIMPAFPSTYPRNQIEGPQKQVQTYEKPHSNLSRQLAGSRGI